MWCSDIGEPSKKKMKTANYRLSMGGTPDLNEGLLILNPVILFGDIHTSNNLQITIMIHKQTFTEGIGVGGFTEICCLGFAGGIILATCGLFTMSAQLFNFGVATFPWIAL